MEPAPGRRVVGIAARSVAAATVYAIIVFALFAFADSNPGESLWLGPGAALAVASAGIFLASLVELAPPRPALAVASLLLGGLGAALGGLQFMYVYGLAAGGGLDHALAQVEDVLNVSTSNLADVWSLALWPFAFAAVPARARLSLPKQLLLQLVVQLALVPPFFLVDRFVPHSTGFLAGLDHAIHLGLVVLGGASALVLPLALRLGDVVERRVLARLFPVDQAAVDQPEQNAR